MSKSIIFILAFSLIINVEANNREDSINYVASTLLLSSKYTISEADFSLNINEEGNKKNIFNSNYSKFIIPATLITYGSLARINNSFVRKLDLDIKDEVNKHYKSKIPYDDYIQHTPGAAVLGLKVAGVKSKNSLRDQTFVMATSYLMMGITVQSTKAATNVLRPDDSTPNAFPSGHTATAFVGAHILCKEYKDTSPWIAVGGYAVATTTGTLRILNRRHWLSDVVAGAGTGILCAEVSYLLLPYFQNMMGDSKNKKSLAVAPAINGKEITVGVSYTF